MYVGMYGFIHKIFDEADVIIEIVDTGLALANFI